MSKKIFIHGGSSLITKFLIKEFSREFEEFYIFCRNKNKVYEITDINKYTNNKFFLYENDLDNLDKTIEDINKLPNDLDGILWVTGNSGNSEKEIENTNYCKKILNINFVNIALVNNVLLDKINLNKDSFICAISSVAGLRGRYKRLHYCAAKSGLISYMSGLRQKYNGIIKVITVIPGYISTNTFDINAPKFLITSPEKCAQKIFQSIKKNQDIIYINYFWKLIMFLVLLMPENIFKKMKF